MSKKANKPVRLIVVGAGNRGIGYAAYALDHPSKVKIVAVAEPRKAYREKMAHDHRIPDKYVFQSWEDLLAMDRFADAAIIATQDALHVEPAIALSGKGYHLMLEKPMAPDEYGCRRILSAALENNTIIAVCHVMRYTRYTKTLKRILDSGAIGQIVSIHHLEPVGYWHQAHSFVRGNWKKEEDSSPMLLAKSCHDIDWICYLMGVECTAVSSFGGLHHFKKSEKPVKAGKAEFCLECQFEPECAYSAKKIYLGRLNKGQSGWPVGTLTLNPTLESVTKALGQGPYGRCVYECDNDVVDHQVVNMQFEGGKTAAFTMTAFTEAGNRKTHIFGTKGEIYGDGSKICRFDFLTDSTETIDTEPASPKTLEGHGGGDLSLMEDFVSAVANNDPQKILTEPEETLKSHRIVFAAERSRREGRIVNL